MFLALYSGLRKMQVPLLQHILEILIINGQSCERHLQLKLKQTPFAAFGASLFLFSGGPVGLEPI